MPNAAALTSKRAPHVMSHFRKILIWSAATLAVVSCLVLALFLMLSSPDRYRETLVGEVQASTGSRLVLEEPLQWQLWPAGIRLGPFTLTSADGKETLLSARQASASLRLADIISGSGVHDLSLSDLNAVVIVQADGSSNWDAVLEKLAQAQPSTLNEVSISKARITLRHEGSDRESTIDIGKLSLRDIGKGHNMPLQGDFLFSRLDGSGGNLLLQNSLNAGLSHEAGKLTLDNSRLTTIVSSTQLPGQTSLDMQGDIVITGKTIHAPGLQAVVLYKNLTMPQPRQANFSGTASVDLAKGQITLTGPDIRGTGPVAYAVQAAELRGNWKNGDMAAEKLAFSLRLQGREISLPTGKALDFSAKAVQEGVSFFLKDIALQLDDSRVSGDASVGWPETGPRYQLHLNAEALDAGLLGDLVGRKGMSGTLSFRSDLQGGGLAWEEALASSKGDFSLQLEKGHLADVNLSRMLWEKLDGYRSFLPTLVEKLPDANGKGTDINKLFVKGRMADGIIRTTDFTADIGKAVLSASGQYNTNDTVMSYQGNLQIEKSLFTDAKAPYVMPVTCQANLKEEHLTFAEALETGCGMSDEARRETLTRALKLRFLDRE